MTTTLQLKKRLILISAIITGALLLAAFSPMMAGKASAADSGQDKPTKKTLNVSGEGIIDASPDMAIITTGAITEDENAKKAQQTNAVIMAKVVAAVKKAGVKDADIKTSGYNISPKYDYNKDTGASKIIGYTVTDTIQVTIRDTSKAGNILDLAAENGANVSSSITFDISDYEKYYNDALKKACEAAKKKASTIAQAFGIKLKVPVTITESGGYTPPRTYMTYDSAAGAKSESYSTPIQAGTLEIKADVSLVYEY